MAVSKADGKHPTAPPLSEVVRRKKANAKSTEVKALSAVTASGRCPGQSSVCTQSVNRNNFLCDSYGWSTARHVISPLSHPSSSSLRGV